MFISLRESRMSGFKRWSDLQQQKYGAARATNRNQPLGFVQPDFAVSTVLPLVDGERSE